MMSLMKNFQALTTKNEEVKHNTVTKRKRLSKSASNSSQDIQDGVDNQNIAYHKID